MHNLNTQRIKTNAIMNMQIKCHTDTIVIYSVFEPYYSKVYYTVYIYNTLLMSATAYCIVNW